MYGAFLKVITLPTPPPADDPKGPPGPPVIDPAVVVNPLYLEYFVDSAIGFALEEAMA
jgi:hypothetical protein